MLYNGGCVSLAGNVSPLKYMVQYIGISTADVKDVMNVIRQVAFII